MLTQPSISIATPDPIHTSARQKIALAMASVGILYWLLVWLSNSFYNLYGLLFSFISIIGGVVSFVQAEYLTKPEGIKNTGVWLNSLTARGIWGWILGILLTNFYIVLYWYGEKLTGLIQLFDPLSKLMRGTTADHWFVYGSLYTFGVLIMGYKFIMKYRHNRYQIIRTFSVMFFQLVFAFLLPSFLKMMNEPEYYFTYFFPLKTDTLKPDGISWVLQSSSRGWGVYFLGFSAVMTFIATPILTYFFGKRWYCSWVCGCGGLAETVGDPFRHLSDKRLIAWKLERWVIHSVLVAVVLMTLFLWVNSATEGAILKDFSLNFSKIYGFLIGSIFSGVIGTGFYPLFGSRVWCRFGCPQAAILGLFQRKKSRFRITTNGGQCISCGNCSTFCEMGIDVRAYAQREENIIRASCVGCGICSAVCPRGVLKLENI